MNALETADATMVSVSARLVLDPKIAVKQSALTVVESTVNVIKLLALVHVLRGGLDFLVRTNNVLVIAMVSFFHYKASIFPGISSTHCCFLLFFKIKANVLMEYVFVKLAGLEKSVILKLVLTCAAVMEFVLMGSVSARRVLRETTVESRYIMYLCGASIIY
jgi:hypothetical protein